MNQYDIEKLAFLYLCNKKYERFVLGKKKMKFKDFMHIVDTAYHLGLSHFALEFQLIYSKQFPEEYMEYLAKVPLDNALKPNQLPFLMLKHFSVLEDFVKQTRNSYTKKWLRNNYNL